MNRFNFAMVAFGCLFAVGCGTSPDEFNEKFADAYCKTAVTCDGTVTFESESDCKAFLEGFNSVAAESCDFDPKASKDCLDEVEAVDCDTLNDTPSCDKVYSGDECE